VPQATNSTRDLTWLLDDMVERVSEARHVVVLSTDGLLIAASSKHLSAVASGLQSLARGAGRPFGATGVRQTIIEMNNMFVFVTEAGKRAHLVVVGSEDSDVGLIAYEMAMLVVRVGKYLTTSPRPGIGTTESR
jgi:predicted regulator of Ras-like GTPase activity (Roadblock/LC7/MglB family)